MLLPVHVYADIKIFTISFNQANDVYVKIYETAQLTMFYVFKSKNKDPR
jgi:hypothetical protein